MVSIRFEDADSEAAALGFLAGRCSFKSFDGGRTVVPEKGSQLIGRARRSICRARDRDE
jgi:hypothetical protein